MNDTLLAIAQNGLTYLAANACLFAGTFGGLYWHARIEERRYRRRQLELLDAATRRTAP